MTEPNDDTDAVQAWMDEFEKLPERDKTDHLKEVTKVIKRIDERNRKLTALIAELMSDHYGAGT